MNNELTTVDTNEAALAAVANGSADLVAAPSCKGIVIASSIGLATTAGAGVAGYFIGKKRAEKNFETRLSKIEDFLSAREYEIVDNDLDDLSDIDSLEEEEEPKKAEKKETEG